MAKTPDTTSSDYDAMAPFWTKVETILGGADAVRAAGKTYLPQFPMESSPDYEYRRTNAKFTNIYADVVGALAAKPFAEEVALEDKAPDQLKTLAEDIDGKGNSMHVFAANVFFGGLNYAVDWILVDYTKAKKRADGRALTIAEEKAQGLRPYWVRIPARRMLAVYSATVAGKEVFVHARMREDITRQVGFDEETVERVRVFDRAPITDETTGEIIGYAPATFEVWEKKAVVENRNRRSWAVVDSGPVTIGVIPLVPFVTGRRQSGSWCFVPPMQDAADLQIEHYQQETGLKSIKELTAYAMLAGNGVQPITVDGQPQQVPVGPKTVLYAPPYGEKGEHGEWKWIEPTAENLKFLAAEVETTDKQLRELGRAPLTAQAGNLTVVTTAFAAQKGTTAIRAWALNLVDALEQAWVLTCRWLNLSDAPAVTWNTDDLDLALTDDKGPETLNSARKNGDLSQRTYWSELKRRGILSADFDAEAEETALAEELPDDLSEQDLAGAQTPPVKQAA